MIKSRSWWIEVCVCVCVCGGGGGGGGGGVRRRFKALSTKYMFIMTEVELLNSLLAVEVGLL